MKRSKKFSPEAYNVMVLFVLSLPFSTAALSGERFSLFLITTLPLAMLLSMVTDHLKNLAVFLTFVFYGSLSLGYIIFLSGEHSLSFGKIFLAGFITFISLVILEVSIRFLQFYLYQMTYILVFYSLYDMIAHTKEFTIPYAKLASLVTYILESPLLFLTFIIPYLLMVLELYRYHHEIKHGGRFVKGSNLIAFGITLIPMVLITMISSIYFVMKNYIVNAKKLLKKESKIEVIAKKAPTYELYFFKRGFIHIGDLFQITRKSNKKKVQQFTYKRNMVFARYRYYLSLIPNTFYILCSFFTIIFSYLLLSILSIIHFIIVGIISLVLYGYICLLLMIDYLFIKIIQANSLCTNCFNSPSIPVYLCHKCNRQHKNLRPGRYGVISRFCFCGEKLPTLLLARREKLKATCQKKDCKHEIIRPERKLISYVFFDSLGTSQTLLKSHIKQFIQSKDSYQILQEGPSIITFSLKSSKLLHLLFVKDSYRKQYANLSQIRNFVFFLDPYSLLPEQRLNNRIARLNKLDRDLDDVLLHLNKTYRVNSAKKIPTTFVSVINISRKPKVNSTSGETDETLKDEIYSFLTSNFYDRIFRKTSYKFKQSKIVTLRDYHKDDDLEAYEKNLLHKLLKG